MSCTFPRTVGFEADGKTISWSPKKFSKEFAPFQLPCGKCLECRLDYARSWAIRCVHEAQMHEKNCFITLTYDDDHLGDNRLDYRDFQLFMKKLRKLQNEPIGVFVTGEYGEKTKRKHWHAIIFGWQPRDAKSKYETSRGDQVYSSETLSKTWGQGIAEYGSVTFESAGYCARYAAKKLVHGYDGQHSFQPISRKSSKYAIGKKWLEKYWRDIFVRGELIAPNGASIPIPRYYEKWFKENHPTEWVRYVTTAKQNKIDSAIARESKTREAFARALEARREKQRGRTTLVTWPRTQNEAKRIILKSKFKLLQDNLKL